MCTTSPTSKLHKCSTGSHRDASRSRSHLACRSWWQYWPHRPIHDSWWTVFSNEILHWCFTDSSLPLFSQYLFSEGQDDLSVWSTLLSFQHTKVTVLFQKSVVAMIHNDRSSNWAFQFWFLFPYLHSSQTLIFEPLTPFPLSFDSKRVRQSPGLPALSMSIPRPKRSVATKMRFWNSLNCLYLRCMMLNRGLYGSGNLSQRDLLQSSQQSGTGMLALKFLTTMHRCHNFCHASHWDCTILKLTLTKWWNLRSFKVNFHRQNPPRNPLILLKARVDRDGREVAFHLGTGVKRIPNEEHRFSIHPWNN